MVPGFDVVTLAVGVVLKGNGAIHEYLLLISKLGVDGDDLVVESHGSLCGAGKEARKTRSKCSACVVKRKSAGARDEGVQLNIICRAI